MNESIDDSQINDTLTSIRSALDHIKMKAASSYSSVSLSGAGFIRGPEIINQVNKIKLMLDSCNGKSTNDELHALASSISMFVNDLDKWDIRDNAELAINLGDANNTLLAQLPPMMVESDKPAGPDDEEERQQTLNH